MKSSTSFVLGLAVGLTTGLLFHRVRAIIEEERPEGVLDRLNDSLFELEQRTQRLENQVSSG